MKVNYDQIRQGYILKDQDTLLIHGIEVKVERAEGWFLWGNFGSASHIFDRLHIEDKDSFVESITELGRRYCIFPETKTAEGLTKVVKALYERSPYKVGDKVKLFDDLTDKPWVTSGMLKDAGKIMTIRHISKALDSDTFNGDPHEYFFEDNVYTWSSNCFSPVTKTDRVKKELADFRAKLLASMGDSFCPDYSPVQSVQNCRILDQKKDKPEIQSSDEIKINSCYTNNIKTTIKL